MRDIAQLGVVGALLLGGGSDAISQGPGREPIDRVASSVRYWELAADIRHFDCDVLGFVVTARSSNFELDIERTEARTRTPRGPVNVPLAMKPSATLDDRFIEIQRSSNADPRMPIEFRMRGILYETRINEALARLATWPKVPWNPALAPYLVDEPLIEASSPQVKDLVQQWVGDQPKRVRPYSLAKLLTARVIDYVEVPPPFVFGRDLDNHHHRSSSGDDLTSFWRGVLESYAHIVLFDASNRGAIPPAATGEASPFEMVALLTAVFRAAGIPARVMIGFDTRLSNQSSHEYTLRAWTEFFLPWNVDENADSVTLADGRWIPVDIVRQEQFSNRSHPLHTPWKYFGNNDELNLVFPLAAHWRSPSELSRRCEISWPPMPAYRLTAQRGLSARPKLRARETAVANP